MIIKVNNDLHLNAPKTYLSNAEAAGTTIIRLKNTSQLSASWALQIGEVGEEQSEVVLLGTATPAGTAGTLTGAISFDHPADTPIYAIKYDKVIFEKSASGTAGTATAITGGTVVYQADSMFTQFDDTTAVSTDAFRSRFLNSVLASQTSQSDWVVPAGANFYSLAKLRERIKEKMWDASFIQDDATFDNWINELKDTMSSAVISVNEDYALGTVGVGFGTSGLGTITTSDFSQLRRVWVTYDGVNFYQSTKSNINDFYPDQSFSSSHPYHAWQGDTVLQILPPESGGTANLVFYRFGTTMVNETDELPLPMRPFTDAFVNYGVAQAFLKDGKTADYQQKLSEVATSIGNFVATIVPRDKSGPKYIDIVSPLDGEGGVF